MTDSTQSWFAYCDETVQNGDRIINLEYLESLNAVLAVTGNNNLKVLDANSGARLQDCDGLETISHKLRCCYHKSTGNVAITNGKSIGYRSHNNGILLFNTALQETINSHSEVVTLEVPISEARLITNFIQDQDMSLLSQNNGNDIKAKDDAESIDCVEELLSNLVKQISSSDETEKVTPSGKWTTVKISLQYSTLKTACQTVLLCHQRYVQTMEKRNLIPGYHQPQQSTYGLPFIASMLHQLVLLYPSDNPGCLGQVIPSPSRELMYAELTRRATFTKWPHADYKYALPHAMAEAGFYHQPASTGDDRAMCFACSVCLVCWEPSDEPWSEHERHSPSCPFVCCQPTINVPLSVTHATQPASLNPFPVHKGSKVKPAIDFICIGENSDLLTAASKCGMIAAWDVSDAMPKLQSVCSISKSSILYLLSQRLKQENFPEANKFSSANYMVTDLEITATQILDKMPPEPELMTCDPQEFLTTVEGAASKDTEQKSTAAEDSTTQPTSSFSKIPALVVGVSVKVDPRPFMKRHIGSSQEKLETGSSQASTQQTISDVESIGPSSLPNPPAESAKTEDQPLQSHMFSLLLFLKLDGTQTGGKKQLNKQQLTMSKTTLFPPQSTSNIGSYPFLPSTNQYTGTNGSMSIPKGPQPFVDDDYVMPDLMEFGGMDMKMEDMPDIYPKQSEIEQYLVEMGNVIDLTQDDVMDSVVENVVDENANIQVSGNVTPKPDKNEKPNSTTILQLVLIDHFKLDTPTSRPAKKLHIVTNILSTEDGRKLLISTCPRTCGMDRTPDTPISFEPIGGNTDGKEAESSSSNDGHSGVPTPDTPTSGEPMEVQIEGKTERKSDTEEKSAEKPDACERRGCDQTPDTPPSESTTSQDEISPQVADRPEDDAQNTPSDKEPLGSVQGQEQASKSKPQQKKHPIKAKTSTTPTSDPPITTQVVKMEAEHIEMPMVQSSERKKSDSGKILVFDIEPSHSIHCVSQKEMKPSDKGFKWIETSPVVQLSNFLWGLSQASFEDDDGDSIDEEGDEQIMKQSNDLEMVGKGDNESCSGGSYALVLTEDGFISVLDVDKMEYVYRTKPRDAVSGLHIDNTEEAADDTTRVKYSANTSARQDGAGEKFTAFVYCSGTERLCTSTDAGRIAFLKMGKHSSGSKDLQKSVSATLPSTSTSSSSTGQDQVDGPKTSSGKLKLTSDQLLVNQPLTTDNLKNLVGLTKSEPLKTRFTATPPIRWREVPLDKGPVGQHLPQTAPQQEKIPLHRKKGSSQPAASGGQQQLQGRRHFRHPNEHFSEHASSYTRAWRLQPDCLSWREHIFELVLPRATNVSHIDLKFVLARKLKQGSDIRVTLLKHPGLSTSKREVLQNARRKWRHKPTSSAHSEHAKPSASETIFPRVMHLLTEGFVEGLMDIDIENPVLLVVEEKEAEDNVKNYVLMDGSKQTIVALCKRAPAELTVGHLVVLKGYMRVKVGVSNVRIIVAALKYFTEDELTRMDVDEVRSMEEDWSSSFKTLYKGQEEAKLQKPEIKKPEDEQSTSGTASQHVLVEERPEEGDSIMEEAGGSDEGVDRLDKDRSSVLFGPVNLSDYIDASGIGGTVTIASRWLIKEARHKALLLQIEDANVAAAGGKFVGFKSEKWGRKGCNHLQELSVVINKAQRINVQHERVQRFSLMCSRSLHTKLLAGICDQDISKTTPPSGERFVAKALPEKIAALDILNWVAALEVADPNERGQGDGKEKKSSNTIAVTRALSQGQTLAWLLCFSDGTLKKWSKSEKRASKTDGGSKKSNENIAEGIKPSPSKVTKDEKLQKVTQSGKISSSFDMKYSLKKFLESCFLNAGREVSVRALRLIFNTLLSVDVVDTKKLSGIEALCDAVMECLEKALERKVESAYAMYCLFQILGVVMATRAQTEQAQSSEFMTLVQKCVSALSKASTVMKDSIHPLHTFLRAEHGLYGVPFDPDRFTIEFVVTGNKNLVLSSGTSPTTAAEKQQEWEKYFSNEELNIQDLVTPKILNIRRGLAVGDFVDGLSVSRFGLIECQPLHFTCIDTSEGCTVGVDSEIDSEGIIAANSSTPELPIFLDAKTSQKSSFNEKIMKGLKTGKLSTDQFKKLIELSDKYGSEEINELLECYAGPKDENGAGPSQQEETYVMKMQQETAPKRSLPTFMETSDSMPPEVDESFKDSAESKVPVNINIPNLSFALPPSTILTVSRMHSGARRRVVLDFGHVVEITDINIPSCPDLSSLVIEAWSQGPKDIRGSGGVAGKHTVTQVGVALDICDHDFVLCSLSPPVICRYLLIIAIGRYGTTNIQTSVNLGRFYGRPAFVGHRISRPQDPHSSAPSPPKKSMRNQDGDTKASDEDHTVLINPLDINQSVSGKAAVQRSLAYLRSYLDDTDCRYSLACKELRSVLAENHAQQSKQIWVVGDLSLEHQGLFSSSKKVSLEKLLEAYKKCSRLQVQRKRVSHAVRYMESIITDANTTLTLETHPLLGQQSDTPPSYTQIQTYCELMLNTLLSLPQGIYFTPQNDPGNLDVAPSNEALINSTMCKEFFTNLVCKGNPRLRVQTVCLLLSYSSPFPWWGDFLCQTLEATFSGVKHIEPGLAKEHLFVTLLALGQRCLAVPQKAENVIQSLLKLTQRLISPSSPMDLDLLTWVLLFMSHLSETIMAQNECFMSDGAAQETSAEDPASSTKKRPATASTGTSTSINFTKSIMPPPPPPLPMVGAGGIMMMPGSSWKLSPWKSGLLMHGHPQTSGISGSAPGTSSPKTAKPPNSKPNANTKEMRFRNRWNYVSVSCDDGSKYSNDNSGYMKIFYWMQAINSKLKYHKSELRSLMNKANDLEKTQGDMEPEVYEAKMKEIVSKASEHHRSVISYRRSLDRKNVYNQLSKVKPQEGGRKAAETVSFPAAFINISVEMCRNVVKNMLSLLLQLDFTVPSDFMVLACKVSSQLSRWCSTQCIYTTGQRSPHDVAKGIKPPLFLSELVSQDFLRYLIILAVGGPRDTKGTNKNSREPLVEHPAGPWVNHAVVSLLQDIIESENMAMSACKTELFPTSFPEPSSSSSSAMDVTMDIPSTSKEEDPQNSEQAEKSAESVEESLISEAEAEQNMKNTEYSQRINLVDNFIKLSEEFLTDIKLFMKERGEDPDAGNGSKIMEDELSTKAESSETPAVPMKKTQLYNQMQTLLSEGAVKSARSPQSSSDLDGCEGQSGPNPMAAFLQNIRLTENGGQKSMGSSANRQFLCSHIYDTRNVNGVSQHVELTMKLCTMGHLKLLSKSITHPPTAIVEDPKKKEETDADPSQIPAPLSSFQMLRKCVQDILQLATTVPIPLTALCEIVLLLQETYKESLDGSLDIVGGESLILLADGGIKALLAAVDAAHGAHDNPRIWSLTLDLLGTLMDDDRCNEQLVENLRLLLRVDSGLGNFFVKLLSCEMSTSNVANGHFNTGTSLLGPSICQQLKKLLKKFESTARTATEIRSKETKGKVQNLCVDLRNFLIFVINMLCSRGAFAHTSATPTDGIIVVVEALFKLMTSCKNEPEIRMWVKNGSSWIMDIFRTVSRDAYDYLNWSTNAVKGDSNRGIDPCSCMQGLFSAVALTSYSTSMSKTESPRDTLMLKILQLCLELTWMVYPDKSSPPSKLQKSPSPVKMDTSDLKAEPVNQEPESQEMDVDNSKMEEQSKPPVLVSFGDLLLKDDEILNTLMSSLALCSGSAMVSLLSTLSITPTLAIDRSATSTGDGVYVLLSGIFEASSDGTLPVNALIKYLAGSTLVEGYYIPQPLEWMSTSHLSQPLLWLILSVFEEPQAVEEFLSLGGASLLVDSLVFCARDTIDSSQGRTSKVLQYLTAASDRAAAFAPRDPVVRHNDPNWPSLGAGKPMPKVTTGPHGFNYPPLQGTAPGAMPSVKVLTPSWRENKDFDFASLATIKCSDATAPLADSLLKPKAAVHRRSRTPLWSYHFPDDKHWVSLTLHFPTAFVLRKVKLQPMMTSLSTEPSVVLLEVNRTGSPSASAYQPVSVPLVTSGMGDIAISPPGDEVVTSIRIKMKRPLDSSSIGLTRIIVNGVSSFMSYHSSSSSRKLFPKSMESLNMLMADSRKNRKSAIHWLRLLHHCLTIEDGCMAPMFRDVIINKYALIPTLCALLDQPAESIHVSATEKVLLATAIPEKVSELIGCILKGSSWSRSTHYIGGFTHSSSQSTINLIYALFDTDNEQDLELRLKEMLKWVTECALAGVDPSGFEGSRADPSHVHAIACGLWKCVDKAATKKCVNLDMTKTVFNWGQSLGTAKSSALASTDFSDPLKKSLDWILCSFCAINVENYNFVLDRMGLTNTQASIISLSNSQIETLAAVSQTKDCIKILGTQGIVLLFSNGLQRFCHNVLEMYQIPTESTSNNLEAALEVTSTNVIAVIEFFSDLCNISLVQEWLGTEEGAKTWQILLKTLYHIMLATNRRPTTGFPVPVLRRRLLLNLQESTITLLKQVTKCNEHNQQLFTRALCDIVSSQLDKSLRVSQLTGFIRSLLLRIVLEDEQFTVSMVATSGQKLQKIKSNSSASGGVSLRHPAFGTGHLRRSFEVGVSSSMKQIWKTVSEMTLTTEKKTEAKTTSEKDKSAGTETSTKKASSTQKIGLTLKMSASGGTHKLKLIDSAVQHPPEASSSSYAGAIKLVKSQVPTASKDSEIKLDEFLDVLATGKSAQEKRKQTVQTVQDMDSSAKQSSLLSPIIQLKCTELEEENLSEDTTLLQLLAKHKEKNIQSFWKSLTLEFDASVTKPSLDSPAGKEDDDVAMDTSDKAIQHPSAERKEQTGNEETHSDADESMKEVKPLKTMLQVFAGLGGLALVARLPTVTLDIGHTPVSNIDQVKPAEQSPFSQQAEPYSSWTAHAHGGWVDDDDWFGFEDDDYYVTPYGGTAKMEQKSQMKMPPPSSVIGSGAGNPCVPAHTMSALCLFLRVPHFAEEFLSQQKPARCLLRLMLGVQDDGQGEQILKLNLAQSLSMLPFTAIRSLLSHHGPTSESGLAIREAMTFDTTSIHLVLACLSSFTHNEPNENMAAGRLLASLLPDQDTAPINVAPPSYKGPMQPQSASSKRVNFANKQAEKNYWAKGTGFGTGSTTSDWDVGNAVKKQKKDEEYITILLEVLANFVRPESESDDGKAHDGEENQKNCLPMDGKFATAIPELLAASGLIPAIASYLRNDSVLDMAHHVPLYCSLLSVIRSFAVCPALCRLLMDSMTGLHQAQSQGPSSGVTSGSDSISALLTKMRKCIDTYASRLKAINTSLESQGEEGLTSFVSNVQKTESMLSKITNEIRSKERKDSEKSDSAGKSSDTDQPMYQLSLSGDSLEKRYIEEMKNLQFDTSELVVEDDEGVFKFPSGHHYATHIKDAANVTDAARARRLAQETVTLSNSLPLSHSSTVFVRCDEERLDVMKVLITGPSETPYANGCFEFDIFFPAEYNQAPPLVNLQTTGNHSVRFNPNLYNDGKVCLSILNTWHGRPEEKWDPQTSSFLQILVSIQSLILVAEPYFNEPGYERSRGTPAGEQSSREYDANIQQATVRWAMLEQLRNPSECFKDVIQNHFWLKKHEILKQCDKWTEEMKQSANKRHGRRTIAHNYTALQRHVTQLKQELAKLKCPKGLEDIKFETKPVDVEEKQDIVTQDTKTSSTSKSAEDKPTQ